MTLALILTLLCGAARAELSDEGARKLAALLSRAAPAAATAAVLKDSPSLRSGAPTVTPKIVVSLPSWDTSWSKQGGDFAGDATPLTTKERELAVSIYGDAIDLDSVRVVTAASPTGEPITLGDHIRMPGGHDFSTGTVIHELAHVWQYQTRGPSYISDSLLHQACAYVAKGERDRAYDYALQPGKKIFEYTAEQQAQIIEDYAVSAKKRADPRYQELLGQVRQAKAFKGHAALFQELEAGLPPREKEPPPIPGWPTTRDGALGSVPQLELRFNLP